jgi:polyhydroxyalkanoate synthase subunit PhaC
MTERDTFTDRADDAAGALDLLLTDAALGPLRRMLPGLAGARFAARLAGRPRTLAVRGTDLLREYAHIATGQSAVMPVKGDRRFADPAWTGNPFLRRLVQAYLATARTAENLVTDADLRWRDEERMRFLVTNLIDALSPSNNPVISQYYIIDLAPGRSLIEYLVSQGHQVFVMSWRNPDARHRGNGLDAYGQCVLDALDAVRGIRGVDQAHLLGLCSGGILASMVAAHLAEAGRLDLLATVNLGVTVLDQATAGLSAAAIDETAARAAIAASARRGYLDGRSLAEVFAWLRPNDLIWNYWINNYLQGRKPPAFDVLYWNADTTRMAAQLHRDFITIAVSNGLTKPGDTCLLGTPIDLFKVNVDSYVIAGVSDHICPWQSCYASTQLLGGKTRFVLSTAGHIASLVNPPDNPKSSFRTAGDNPPDADAWLRTATVEKGSWWPDYSRWLAERSGPLITSPATLGSADYPPREPAPGTYVFDR